MQAHRMLDGLDGTTPQKPRMEELEMFDENYAALTIRLAGNDVELMREDIDRFGIDDSARRSFGMRLASRASEVRRDAAKLRDRGKDDAASIVDRAADVLATADPSAPTFADELPSLFEELAVAKRNVATSDIVAGL